ncbi:hypothetical protein AQY21_26995 [Paracoccus sp. MKU1]|nr:hypothetical protein AQY21_26995 [Paracoccus sp. MKU1]
MTSGYPEIYTSLTDMTQEPLSESRFCAGRMMVGPDHGGVDHLELVRRDLRVVQCVQAFLP